MQVKHLAIDGSVVDIEADADLGSGVTTAGWAIVPSLLRSHPFSVHPPGYSHIVERTIASGVAQVNVQSRDEFSVKDGQLRVAEIQLPTPTRATRQLTIGAWEGRSGCITTSFVGGETRRLIEAFDTLQFRDTGNGIVIDSPFLPTPRPPQMAKEIPGLGIVSIRPAIASELQRVPKARGFQTGNAELFRLRAESEALLLVSQSAVAVITPLDKDTSVRLQVAGTLRIEWKPRRGSQASGRQTV